MKVKLIPGIASMSGTLCKNQDGSRYIITTRKAATTNPVKVRMYFRPASSYQRKTPISEKELAARCRFAILARRVKELMEQHVCRTRKEAWQIAKEELKNNEQLGL